MLLRGLETGYCEYDGELRQAAARRDPARAVQVVPRPHLRGGRLARVAPHHGQARRRPPDHPAEAVAARSRRSSTTTAASIARSTAADAPPPISAGWTFCDASAERAREMATTLHRRLLPDGARPLPVRRRPPRKTKGYEYYGKMSEKIAAVWRPTRVIDFFATCRCGARPSSATSKILDIHRRTGNSHFVGVFCYAGMPYDEAERNMRLFARRGDARAAEARGDRGGAAGAGRRRHARRPPRAGLLTWRSRRSSTTSPTGWPRSRSTVLTGSTPSTRRDSRAGRGVRSGRRRRRRAGGDRDRRRPRLLRRRRPGRRGQDLRRRARAAASARKTIATAAASSRCGSSR